MTSAPEAHKTAGVLATVRPLDFANALHHAFEAGKSGIAWPDYDGDSPAVDRINAALYPWLFSTPSVPSVAELLGDGLARRVAGAAERVTDAMVDAAASVIWADRDARMGGPWKDRSPDEICVIQSKATARAAILAALTASPAGDDPKALDAEARIEDGGEVERAVLAERETCLSVIAKVRDHWRNAEKEWSSASDLRDLQSFLVGKAAKHKADFAEEIMAAIRALSTPVPAACKPEGDPSFPGKEESRG